jgi:hypothetical protein
MQTFLVPPLTEELDELWLSFPEYHQTCCGVNEQRAE